SALRPVMATKLSSETYVPACGLLRAFNLEKGPDLGVKKPPRRTASNPRRASQAIKPRPVAKSGSVGGVGTESTTVRSLKPIKPSVKTKRLMLVSSQESHKNYQGATGWYRNRIMLLLREDC